MRCAWGHWDFGGGGEPSRALGPPVGPPGWVSDPGVVPGARGGRLAAFLDEPGGWSNCPENGNCWFLLPPPHFRGLTPAQETGLRGQRASRQPKSRLCPAPGPWVPSEHPWVPRVPPQSLQCPCPARVPQAPLGAPGPILHPFPAGHPWVLASHPMPRCTGLWFPFPSWNPASHPTPSHPTLCHPIPSPGSSYVPSQHPFSHLMTQHPIPLLRPTTPSYVPPPHPMSHHPMTQRPTP